MILSVRLFIGQKMETAVGILEIAIIIDLFLSPLLKKILSILLWVY